MKMTSEPFKNSKKMRVFERSLLNHGHNPKEIYMIWQIGKVCLLRISDILKLKTNQVYNRKGCPNKTVITTDKKTKKYNPLNLEPLRNQLGDYRDWRIVHKIRSTWLFPESSNFDKPLKRQAVYRLFRLSASLYGFKHITAHSARKTGAYILYKSTNNLAMVSKMLNHSSERITERYLGISDPAIKSATNAVDWNNIPN